MKVLMVTNMYPSPERPGWGAFIKTQIDSLERAGIVVDLLVIEGYKSQLNYLKAILALRRRCRAQVYDIVHAHYGLSGLVARAQFRYPVIVSYCGDDLYGHADANGRPTPTSLFWVALHKLLARFVAGTIVKSEAMNRLLPRPNAAVIPNGVDFDVFKPLDRAACRAHLGLDPDKSYVLFPYSPTRPRKNFPLVQAAVDLLNRRLPEPKRRLETLVVEGVPQSEIPVYMNAADVLVLASCWEGSPNVVKEAMACNLRVVATDVGDVRALFGDAPGYAVCEPTAASIADRVQQVLAVPEPSTARQGVAHLSLDRIAQRVIDEYTKVLSNRKGTRQWLGASAS